MSDAKPQPEPSIEEILASIGRIVAEDATKAPAPVTKNDVLELTEAVDENGNIRRLAPIQSADEPPAVEGAGRTAKVPADDKAPRLDRGENEPLVSTATASAAATALGRLAAVPRGTRSAAGEEEAAAATRTLEQIVGDALHPLLRAWLDEHLPELVEKVVREEVARITKDAGYG